MAHYPNSSSWLMRGAVRATVLGEVIAQALALQCTRVGLRIPHNGINLLAAAPTSKLLEGSLHSSRR